MRITSALALASLCLTTSSVAALTLTLNCDGNSGIPNICDGICYYANCRGGKSDFPSGFNYDPDSSVRSTRRKAIGCNPGGNYCQGQGSCDEFPFASSFQGGLGVANGGYPSASRGETTCVPVNEQQRQGGQIRAQVGGKPSGTNYGILVSNFASSPNCANAQRCRPQSTTKIVTQRQGKRGMEAFTERQALEATPSIDAQVTHYETVNGTVLMQLFGPDLGDNPDVFVPDVNHPEGGFMAPARRITGTPAL